MIDDWKVDAGAGGGGRLGSQDGYPSESFERREDDGGLSLPSVGEGDALGFPRDCCDEEPGGGGMLRRTPGRRGGKRTEKETG